MLRTLAFHIRQQWMGAAALFLVLAGGTAYAVDGPLAGQNTIGSEDIIGNEVKSDDIGNGRIFNLDIADDIITGQKLKDGTVTSADIDESTLDLLDSSYENGAGSCNDDDGLGTTCVADTVLIPRPGRVLLVGSVAVETFAFDDSTGENANADSASRVEGRCLFTQDGAEIGQTAQTVGETRTAAGATPAHYSPSFQSISLNGLSTTLTSGEHTFGILCKEVDGDIDFTTPVITLVALGQ